jgi:serine/threonine protein kinase
VPELRTMMSFYKILHPLGEGAFGKVVLAEQVLTGCKVAIKMIEKSIISTEEARRKVFREIFILKRISSRFVVKILEYFENDEGIFIVLNYSAGGDLLSYLKINGAIPEPFAKYLFKQVLMGIKSVHSEKVLHRDIKLDNILLDSSQTCVQVCDFGISKIIKKHEILNEKCGTPAYLAPEIVLECGYQGFWSDCWSLGVVLYCMVCGKVPFKGNNLNELNKAILNGKVEIPAHLSNELKDLLGSLLKHVPFERITVQQAIEHQWFQDCQGISEENHQYCHKGTLRKMIEIGFPKDFILNSIKNQSLNHAYAVYNLLLEEFS